MGNNHFKRDDRDLFFVLKEHLKIEKLLTYDKFKDFTMDDFEMVIDLAKKVARDEMAPTLQDTDRGDAARFENGMVKAPQCFHKLWEIFSESGMFALTQSPEYGGQGLPLVVAEAATEFFMSANFAFGTYSGMGPGQGAMIENFGSEKQKHLFCEKLYNGTWGGAMALTEPDAGSDAHMITAKAVKDGEHYKITASKVFITSGDHDLTENIIHLVLARIEGAPTGAKGVSLFAVPKIWVNEDGTPGESNDVHCVGLEHKMGLHGSATCQMSYGDNGECRGHLIGEPGMGLGYMFQMVNVARMAVGLECTAFAANIYSNALEYARQRVQGTKYGEKTGRRVPIIEHAEIRRLLMTLKSFTEGMRAMVYKGYMFEDIAHASGDAAEKQLANDSLAFFTPIIKGYTSERIWELCSMGIQILGGYGYTAEYPIEQYARDCKIFSIWDGTTYVQAIDLVGRKLGMNNGRAFQTWVNEINTFITENRSDEYFAPDLSILEEAVNCLLSLAEKYRSEYVGDKADLVPLTATRFLECCGEVAIGHLLLEQAFIAGKTASSLSRESADYNFYMGKIASARFFARNILPGVMSRKRIIEMDDTTAAALPEIYL